MKLGNIYNPNTHHKNKDSNAEVRAKKGLKSARAATPPRRQVHRCQCRHRRDGTAGQAHGWWQGLCVGFGKSQSRPGSRAIPPGSTLAPRSGGGAALWEPARATIFTRDE